MLSKSAEIESAFKKHVIFTESARSGWQLILESLPKDSKVLLPSYIGITDREGSGIYDPIINTDLNHDFYMLNDDLSISIDKIENSIKSNKYKLVLLVHYFGFKISNIEEISRLCKERGVIVVEDCAHLYTHNINYLSNAGTFGDFVFYSLHKSFPFKKGGLLVQNNSNLPLIENKINQVNYTYSDLISSYDITAIVNKRLSNYKLISHLIKDIAGVIPLKEFANEDLPHTFPIIVKNNLREKLYFWLIEKNIHVTALYYRLIPPLQNKKYSLMLDISSSILNLPIHQDVNESDIYKLIENIKYFYEEV